MSEIKTDKLTGVGTAGVIVVTGEGNSTTTNLQQGLAKSWISINTTGTIATRDSFNVSSATDVSTGAQKIGVTASFAGSDNMSPSAAAWNNNISNGKYGSSAGIENASSYWIGAFWAGSSADVAYMCCNVHGDLA
jgi:hypothetical protein